jgi:ParB-like chromosome segregation protein Spo0J
MQHSDIVILNIRDLVAHPRNPRKISQESLNRLCDSIRKNGYWEHRPMAVEPVPEQPGKYYILDGNQRKKALGRLKRYEVPCMIYTELTDEERDDIILRSNVNNGEWDEELLAEWDAALLDDWGVDISALSEKDFLQVGEENYGDQFTLPSGEKEPFQQMTFTIGDEQAQVIKDALEEAKHLAEYDYIETFGNQNTNGNALYLIVSQWAEQRK